MGKDKYVEYALALSEYLPAPFDGLSKLKKYADLLGRVGKLFGGALKFKTKLKPAPPGTHYGSVIERTGTKVNDGRGEMIRRTQVIIDNTTGFPVMRWSYSYQGFYPLLGISWDGAVVFGSPELKGSAMKKRINIFLQERGAPANRSRGWTQERHDKQVQQSKLMIMSGVPCNRRWNHLVENSGGGRASSDGGRASSDDGRASSDDGRASSDDGRASSDDGRHDQGKFTQGKFIGYGAALVGLLLLLKRKGA